MGRQEENLNSGVKDSSMSSTKPITQRGSRAHLQSLQELRAEFWTEDISKMRCVERGKEYGLPLKIEN